MGEAILSEARARSRKELETAAKRGKPVGGLRGTRSVTGKRFWGAQKKETIENGGKGRRETGHTGATNFTQTQNYGEV